MCFVSEDIDIRFFCFFLDDRPSVVSFILMENTCVADIDITYTQKSSNVTLAEFH